MHFLLTKLFKDDLSRFSECCRRREIILAEDTATSVLQMNVTRLILSCRPRPRALVGLYFVSCKCPSVCRGLHKEVFINSMIRRYKQEGNVIPHKPSRTLAGRDIGKAVR